MPQAAGSPSVFNVFVDAACDGHGHDGVVPGGDEHERQAQAHSQERKSPGRKKESSSRRESAQTSARFDLVELWRERTSRNWFSHSQHDYTFLVCDLSP